MNLFLLFFQKKICFRRKKGTKEFGKTDVGKRFFFLFSSSSFFSLFGQIRFIAQGGGEKIRASDFSARRSTRKKIWEGGANDDLVRGGGGERNQNSHTHRMSKKTSRPLKNKGNTWAVANKKVSPFPFFSKKKGSSLKIFFASAFSCRA